ncbi:molybdopterin-guanine dinucleotide biosynthesis protein B [Halocalculus aciditolerans]|uniref:Molybdopterin-guanine dinucleotide biosynthesis protein B n=1 Tax=Halocalculus aciditolerans TaxID=1383812 RepID=A0A830F947_9EURY|nr:molybdopterin-guanine dinucleotide biosynthesis protein B [Halocalculus aciditolerans]GGL51304.1 molybdopterin-guanine dinucleotide biosynthesis protein B [Halocalculus aciditolerans]
MKVVSIVGVSDAGKTTLVERLVPIFAERGRVGTVKSMHHDFELDEEGKDTHRHRTAGAARVVGVTPSLTATFEPRGRDDYEDADAALDALLDGFEGFDVVLVEGFREADTPNVLVGDQRERALAGDVVATVSDGTADDVDLVGLRDRVLDLPDY